MSDNVCYVDAYARTTVARVRAVARTARKPSRHSRRWHFRSLARAIIADPARPAGREAHAAYFRCAIASLVFFARVPVVMRALTALASISSGRLEVAAQQETAEHLLHASPGTWTRACAWT